MGSPWWADPWRLVSPLWRLWSPEPPETILASLFEAVPDAIVVVDRQGRIVRANAQADRTFGYPPGELAGQPIEVVVPERHRPGHRELREAYGRDPSQRRMGEGRRLYGRRRDGVEFPVDISLTPIGTGAARVVMAVVRDLSERREALRRFRRLLESAPDGMLLVDRSGRIVMANGRSERLFGYAPRELVGLPLEALVPEQARARHRRGFASFWEQPRVSHMGGPGAPEIWGVRKDGTTVPIELDLGPLEADAGLLAVASIRDLSERRKAEREREDLLQQLQRSRERLRVLSRRVLEAQEAERRAIAHELHDEIGQALTAVSLDLQALQTRATDATRPLIDSALEITRGVIAQVRELSLDLRPSLLDDLGLAAAIRWSLDRHEQRLGWTTELRGDLGDTRVPGAIETACFRVAQEALTNVAKHAGARTVSVDVRYDDGELVLVVRDDGQGFDVDEERTKAAAGNSIGLLGMEERVTSAGGRFAVESERSRGTTVRARFPIPVETA
jgi:PAS domain S-box-containing protein